MNVKAQFMLNVIILVDNYKLAIYVSIHCMYMLCVFKLSRIYYFLIYNIDWLVLAHLHTWNTKLNVYNVCID